MSILKWVLFTEKNRSRISVHWRQWACKGEDEHSLLLSYNMTNNWVCWWRKTGQNAWKWSIFLREKPTPSSTETPTDSGWQSSLWFHGHQFPPGFEQICLSTSWGSSARCDLQCAHVHLTLRASDAICSCHSSTAPVPSLGKEASFSEHAWTPVETLLQECDWDLRYGAAHGALSYPWSTNPGAAPAYGNEPTKQRPCQNAGWKLTVAMWMRAGRAGENELSFEFIMATSIHMAGFLHTLATLSFCRYLSNGWWL